jgi:hypothetical protein
MVCVSADTLKNTKFLAKISTTEHPVEDIAVMRYFVKGMEITSNFVPPGPLSKPTILKLQLVDGFDVLCHFDQRKYNASRYL